MVAVSATFLAITTDFFLHGFIICLALASSALVFWSNNVTNKLPLGSLLVSDVDMEENDAYINEVAADSDSIHQYVCDVMAWTGLAIGPLS